MLPGQSIVPFGSAVKSTNSTSESSSVLLCCFTVILFEGNVIVDRRILDCFNSSLPISCDNVSGVLVYALDDMLIVIGAGIERVELTCSVGYDRLRNVL